MDAMRSIRLRKCNIFEPSNGSSLVGFILSQALTMRSPEI